MISRHLPSSRPLCSLSDLYAGFWHWHQRRTSLYYKFNSLTLKNATPRDVCDEVIYSDDLKSYLEDKDTGIDSIKFVRLKFIKRLLVLSFFKGY